MNFIMYQHFIKRVLDFFLALVAIIGLSPIFFILTIILILTNDDSEVFFFQKRPGKGGHIFTLVKFKTMKDISDKFGRQLPDSKRLTRIGRFIRSTSLDELPQLFNVIKGDMSLVGPRPLLVQYLHLYTREQARRHEVRPGITGWAQTHGRNSISWARKFDLDIWYVDHISFVIDLKIIILTLKKIVSRSDINSSSDATMPTFNGSN